VLLYDGLCGFCDGVVQFILARDRRGSLRFAPLGGDFARALFDRHPELREMDSLVLASGEGPEATVAVRSEAALQLARYLGGPWRLAGPLRLVPPSLRDWVYDLFARHRYRIFGRRVICRVPDPADRARFLA